MLCRADWKRDTGKDLILPRVSTDLCHGACPMRAMLVSNLKGKVVTSSLLLERAKRTYFFHTSGSMVQERVCIDK